MSEIRPEIDLALSRLEPYMDRLDELDPVALRKVYGLAKKLKEIRARDNAQTHYLEFVKYAWPAFIEGTHHGLMADAFEQVASGKLKRLIINMPPRHTKSEFASYLLPSWFLGKYPDKKVIQTAHTAELAVGFGRKVRNLVGSEEYQKIFPGVSLQQDSKAAGRWNTSAGGEYFAIGVGGAVTGKGADLLIIDDPHACSVDTLIATTVGWKTIGDVQVGDSVYGSDGRPTQVTHKSEVYEDRPLYRASCSDGAEIFCDAKHLWTVRHATNVDGSRHTHTAEDLVDYDLQTGPYLDPVSLDIEEDAHLPIDPYTLGCWLGDGTSTLGRITSEKLDQPYIRARIEKAGYQTTDLKDPWSFGILELRKQLIDNDLINNKHVPIKYMLGSTKQRMSLLCGLMDTDGNVTAAGQSIYHGKDFRLVNDVRKLLNTFGIYPTVRSYYTAGQYGSCLMHRVTFKMKGSSHLPRKKERTCDPSRRALRTLEVEETKERGDVQCITVENEDGLFLAGEDLVLTHNSEQEGQSIDPSVFDRTYEWYTSGPRQRLQPGGSIVIVMTRWHKRDLTGQIIKSSIQRVGADEWKLIELPAILPSGNVLWPEFWSMEELEKLRVELPVSKWSAQYQQDPTSEEGAIIKREWWGVWEEDEPPKCEFIIQSWDTAFLKTQRADYSACTTWGIFYEEDDMGRSAANLILLDAHKDRLEFPDLKKKAFSLWQEWSPDAFVIEGKAAGMPLIFELRNMGIPVQEYTPSRGNDKIARVNAVADLFASGIVWAPQRRFAEEVIEEFAAFPSGDHDDLVDSSTQALLRFRQGGFVPLYSDEEDQPMKPRNAEYY